MPAGMRPTQPNRPRRARFLALTTLATGVLIAGCGRGSPNPAGVTAGSVTSAGSNTAAGGRATSSGSSAPVTGAPSGVAFARCMRANGVPNFPDPNPGGGLSFNPAGVNRAAPAFKAAQAKCQKLLPDGGRPGPGTQTHPSAQTMAKLLTLAECMRQHGVPQFPDPTTSVPANFPSTEYTGLTDYDGAILVFPSTINFHSPAYTQAAAACGSHAQKIGLGHPH